MSDGVTSIEGVAASGLADDAAIDAPAVAPPHKDAGSANGMSGIARQTVVYGAGMMVGKMLSILLMPVYTRFLSPADYGVMELIVMALDVVMIIAGGIMAQGIYRFYNKATSVEEANAVVATAFVGLMVTFSAMGGATFIAADWLSELMFASSDHAYLIRVAAITVALTPLMMVPKAYFRMRDRATIVVASHMAKLGVAAALNVVLLLLGMGVLSMFISALAALVMVGGTLTYRMLREIRLRCSTRALRDLTRYGVPLIGTNIATFTFTFSDRFFLQRAAGETAVGLYSFAYQFGFMLLVVGYGPFMDVWQPRRFRIADLPDRDALYSQGFIYANVMLFATATGMILFVGDFFRIMATPDFYPAAALVPVIVVAYMFHGWSNIQDIGILIRERTEYQTLANWVAAGVALTGFAVLTPLYHAWGAAIAALITFVVRWVLIYNIAQWLWPVRYRWTPVLKLAGLAFAVCSVGLLLPDMTLFVSLPVRAVLYAMYLWAVWNAGVLTEPDRAALRARVSRVVAMVRQSVPQRA